MKFSVLHRTNENLSSYATSGNVEKTGNQIVFHRKAILWAKILSALSGYASIQISFDHVLVQMEGLEISNSLYYFSSISLVHSSLSPKTRNFVAERVIYECIYFSYSSTLKNNIHTQKKIYIYSYPSFYRQAPCMRIC